MKKLYKKPKITRVKLIAEEAVLTDCKTAIHRGNRTCTNGTCIASVNADTNT